MSRIGVFVCHCGINIASTVDVEQVAREVGRHPEVVFSTDYKYMCSNPGQQLVRDAIAEHELDGVVATSRSVVEGCSPVSSRFTTALILVFSLAVRARAWASRKQRIRMFVPRAGLSSITPSRNPSSQ